MSTPISDEWYRPREVSEHGWIRGPRGGHEIDLILRLIRAGVLPAKNMSQGSVPQYLIRGEEIRKWQDQFN